MIIHDFNQPDVKYVRETCICQCKSITSPIGMMGTVFQANLKMPGPISQNGNFYSTDASSPKISWFQISFKSVKPFGHKK